MITRFAFFVLALTLLAARPALAQESPHVVYQNALLARPLSSADASFCAGIAKSSDEVAACHVTRLLLADAAKNQDRGFPPLTDIKYTVGKETSKVMDLMTKYGG